MPDHHSIFDNFSFASEPSDDIFRYNGLGGRERKKFTGNMILDQPHYDEQRLSSADSRPGFSEEYFEWVDILSAVNDAKDEFIMAEIGAGFGRWLITAVTSLRQLHPQMPYRLIGIEAERTHFQWLHDNMVDNDIDLERCQFTEAAVTNREGTIAFCVGDAANWWGQHIPAIPDEKLNWKGKLGRAIGLHTASMPAYETVDVSARRLGDIIDSFERIDIVDIDIQGAEGDVIEDSVSSLTAKAKRLHVGTHNQDVEDRIRQAMINAGWTCVWDFPCHSTSSTQYGEIKFVDGISSWLNPMLK